MHQSDFPQLEEDLLYFDSAATALKPQVVVDTIRRFYEKEYGTIHRAVYKLSVRNTEREQEVRQKVANLINAPATEEIIFTKGTTESLNLAAVTLGARYVEMGDEILISEIEHHSNIVPWQLLCERKGATLKVLPVDDRGELIVESLETLLSHRTKIVSVGHISNSLGTINPIRQIADAAHEVGAIVVVDGAQATPHMRVDVQELGADFYAFSGHKLYGPTGIGILWGKRDILEELPPYQGGGDMIEHVSFEETSYNQLPFRFEAGTPNIAGIFGLGAAIDYVNAIGLEKIHSHEATLLAKATEALRQIPGLNIIGEAAKKAAIISFTIDNVHPLDLATLLDLKNIAIRTGHHCAQPTMERFGVSATARISFGIYNEEEEIDRFSKALGECLAKLR